MMAASVGIGTIDVFEAIRLLKEMPATNDEELEARRKKSVQICSAVSSKIIFASSHCLDDDNKPEDEVLYGTAGYL